MSDQTNNEVWRVLEPSEHIRLGDAVARDHDAPIDPPRFTHDAFFDAPGVFIRLSNPESGWIGERVGHSPFKVIRRVEPPKKEPLWVVILKKWGEPVIVEVWTTPEAALERGKVLTGHKNDAKVDPDDPLSLKIQGSFSAAYIRRITPNTPTPNE